MRIWVFGFTCHEILRLFDDRSQTVLLVIAWQFVKRTWQRTPYSMDNTKNAYIKNFTYLKEIYAYFYKTNGKIDQKRLDYFFTKACN